MRNVIPDIKTMVGCLILIAIVSLLAGCATGGLVTGPFSNMAVESNRQAMSERRGAANSDSLTAWEIFKNVLGIAGDGVLYYGVKSAIDNANEDSGPSVPDQAYTVTGDGNTFIVGNTAGVDVNNSQGM